jgi:large subunit ribosomal protein L4
VSRTHSEAGALDVVAVERRSSSGELLGQVGLDPAVFGAEANVPLVHQVVTAQLAAGRSGTQSTRTRAEVRGGSAKPFRQKGTGNARQGSIRAPHYSGGGVALGPKPRSYVQRTPRKMVQQALRCALSDRAASGRLCVVDRWAFSVPRTKDARAFLLASGCSGTVLVVLGRDDVLAAKSFANLPEVITIPGDQLSAYDVLVADHVVLTEANVPGGVTPLGRGPSAGTERVVPAEQDGKAPVRASAVEDDAAGLGPDGNTGTEQDEETR